MWCLWKMSGKFSDIHGKCKWFERSLDIAVFFFFVFTPHQVRKIYLQRFAIAKGCPIVQLNNLPDLINTRFDAPEVTSSFNGKAFTDGTFCIEKKTINLFLNSKCFK